MDGKTYGSLNYETYMGDSSNHVKDSRDPVEGIPERMQRLSQEPEHKDNKSISAKWMDFIMGRSCATLT